MRRYSILAAAVIMQMCLGATYAWSVFVQPLKALTGLLQGTVQLPFSIFYFAFPATMVVSGGLVSRFGPRVCAVCGGILFGSGWLIARFGAGHFWLTAFGIGLVAGVGAGLAYIVPIATCILWFPRHRGVVTGIAVAGFGGGAALVSQVAGRLIVVHGFTPFDTLGFLGTGFLFTISLAGLVMDNPPGFRRRRPAPLRLRDVLAEPAFRLLYFSMFAGLAAGFAVSANMKELLAGGGVQSGILAVSFFAVANAFGRISWGCIFDRVRPSSAIRVNLLLQAVLVLCAWLILRSATGLLVFACLAGFNYGGLLVLYASSAAAIWGSERVGQIYGWLFSANICAALAPIATGYVFDWSGSFVLPLAGLGLLMLVAVLRVSRRRGLLDEGAGYCAL